MASGKGFHCCCLSLRCEVFQSYRACIAFTLFIVALLSLAGCGFRGRPLRPEVSETAIWQRMTVSDNAIQQTETEVSRSKETPAARSGDRATTRSGDRDTAVVDDNVPPEIPVFSLADAIAFAVQN